MKPTFVNGVAMYPAGQDPRIVMAEQVVLELQAENERLREALREIADTPSNSVFADCWIVDIAREALRGAK